MHLTAQATTAMMKEPLIIFDGKCNFCNASINFIIKHDATSRFNFATTHSQNGRRILSQLGMDPDDPTTFVFIDGGTTYLQSDAALKIAQHLRRPWSFFFYLTNIPKAVRDFAYSILAKHRYKISGQRDTCMTPSAEVRQRFLD